ncbi:MAG TPA: D-aminoacyl-tRNA deacylase [Byssovorax sp.]
MRAVVQRARSARVEVAGQITGAIERGLVAFVAAGKDDVDADVAYLAAKVTALRVFSDDTGRMSRALADVGGGLLVVSQFTLYGDVRRGNRPGFDAAMEPARAEQLYEAFLAEARRKVTRVETGRFRADMRVFVENDGPVTILLDSRRQF